MNRHGMDNSEIKELNEFAKDNLRSFLIGFVFLRDDQFFPIIIWPGENIKSSINSFDHKTICDIGAVYLFKHDAEDIKILYDAYCDSKLDNLCIWDDFRTKAEIDKVEIENYGMPFINFYSLQSNGMFAEADSLDISTKDNDKLEEFWGNEPSDIITDLLF